MKRSLVLSVTALAATGALTLAGCGSSSSTAGHSSTPSGASSTAAGAPAAGPHNAADISFAGDMVPHHRQAVEMADMAAAQATDARVKALAADIKGAQDPEIDTMTGWLAGWGSPVPSGSGGSTGSMGSMGGTGMMSDADMSALAAAHVAAFDRMWVQMMVQHHTGAVAMARTELSAGANAEAKALAQSIVTSQTAQIGQLQTLLAQLPTA